MRLKKFLTFVVTLLMGVSSALAQSDDLYEIAQSQGSIDDGLDRTTMEEGSEYTTYTAEDGFLIAVLMEDIDVTNCDYVILKFAEPITDGWEVGFWDSYSSEPIPSGSTEYKYVFSEDPLCAVTNNVLPKIMLMSNYDYDYEEGALQLKVTGIYKHKLKAAMKTGIPYYIRNAGSGMFLCGENLWGSQASLSNAADKFTLEATSGGYEIVNKSLASNVTATLLQKKEAAYYVDGASTGGFAITPASESSKYYSIYSNEQKKYIVYNPEAENGIAGVPIVGEATSVNGNNGLWEFLTPEEFEQEMADNAGTKVIKDRMLKATCSEYWLNASWNSQVTFDLPKPLDKGKQYRFEFVMRGTGQYAPYIDPNTHDPLGTREDYTIYNAVDVDPWLSANGVDNSTQYCTHMVAGKDWSTVSFVSNGNQKYDHLTLCFGDTKGEVYITSFKIIEIASDNIVYSTEFDNLNDYSASGSTFTMDLYQEDQTVSKTVDATSLISNPRFSRNHDNSKWTFDNINAGGPNNLQSASGNYMVEAYQREFEVSQELTVPNGYYTLSANAFYANSNQNVPVLYANEKSVEVVIKEDGTIDTMEKASNAFVAGNYINTVPTVLVTDGKLKIGVKGGYSSGGAWCIFDNFTLVYSGAATDLSALKTALNTALISAQAIYNKNAKMGKVANDNLKSAIDTYKGKTYDNPSDYNTAIQTVNNAISDANISIAGYELFTPYVDKVNNLDDAGQNAFYANSTAKNLMLSYKTGTIDETNFQTLLTEIEAAYVEGVKKQLPVADMTEAAPAAWSSQSGGSGGSYGGINNGHERYEASIFSADADLTQTITGLQNGTYEVDIEGASSFTEGNGVSGGTTGSNRTELFANDETFGISVVNRTWVSEGETDRTTFTVKVTDGTLTYGIRNKLQGANWFVVRLNSIKFTKGGTIDDLKEDLKELKATANEIIAENPAMNAGIMKTLKDAATKNPADESVAAYNTCISDLTKAISNANSSAANYKVLGNLLGKSDAFDENGKAAFTSNPEIVPIYNVYNNGTYDEVTDYTQPIAIALADAAKKQTTEGADMTLAALGGGCSSAFEVKNWYLQLYDVNNDVYSADSIRPTLTSGQYGFQLNTWSTENSTLKTPFMEYWTNRWDATTPEAIRTMNLSPARIRHNTIEGLPQGLYKVKLWARYTNEDPNNNNWFMDESGNIDYPQGAKFVANGEETDLYKNCEGRGTIGVSPIVYGNYTVETFVGREGTLDFGFDIPADGFGNWIAFKNLSITYLSYTDAATILTSKGTGDDSAAGTFYAPFDAKMPTGVKAYTVDYMYQKDGQNAKYTSSTPVSLDGRSYYYTHETIVADGDSPYATEKARQNAADEETDKAAKAEILATPLNTIPAGTPVILRTLEPVSRMYVYGTPKKGLESATYGIIKGATIGSDAPANAWTLQKFVAPNKLNGKNVTTVGFKKLTSKQSVDDNRCYVVFLDGEANIDIVDSVGKGTFVAPIAIEIPEDVQAYTIENLDKGTLIQEPVDRLIPAKTAVVVNMKDKDSKTVNFKFKFVKEKTNKFLYVTGVLSGVLDDESYAVPARSYVLQRLAHTKVLKRQDNGSYAGEYVPTSVLAKWYASENRDNTYELTHKTAENIKAYLAAYQQWEADRKAGTNENAFFTEFPIPYWTDDTKDPVTKFKTAFYRVGEFEEGDTEKYVYVPNNKCFINGSKANVDSEAKALYFEDDEDFGDVTDIIAVEESASDATSGIYSVDGQKLNSLKKGVNIVKMSDGSTKKIMVK